MDQLHTISHSPPVKKKFSQAANESVSRGQVGEGIAGSI